MYTIALHTTYFKNSSDNRNQEILRAFRINLSLSVVARIYVYTECELPIIHPKLIPVYIQGRPNFRILFSHFEEYGVNIICNSDISFKKNLKKILHIIDRPSKVCFVSRRIRLDFLGKHIVFKHNTGNSQDAWGFYGKITDDALSKILEKIEIGVPGNDNALVYLFRKYTYEVLNPSYAITLLHHHRSDKRNYTESDRLNLEYDFVKPSVAMKYDLLEYAMKAINLIYYHKWFR